MDKVLRKPDLKKAKRLYDELLSIRANIKNAAGQNAHNVFDYVATTNYDLVLESYARGTLHIIVILKIKSGLLNP